MRASTAFNTMLLAPPYRSQVEIDSDKADEFGVLHRNEAGGMGSVYKIAQPDRIGDGIPLDWHRPRGSE